MAGTTRIWAVDEIGSNLVIDWTHQRKRFWISPMTEKISPNRSTQFTLECAVVGKPL
jgi:hypothetical protein